MLHCSTDAHPIVVVSAHFTMPCIYIAVAVKFYIKKYTKLNLNPETVYVPTKEKRLVYVELALYRLYSTVTVASCQILIITAYSQFK